MGDKKSTPARACSSEVQANRDALQGQHSIALSQAAQFLQIIDPGAQSWTFQTFDDNKGRGSKQLARVFHGSFDQHAAALEELNRQGAGVFVTINETDGKGRKRENVRRVRAVFADFDGTSLPAKLPRPPHLVVQSSSGRWHVYWRVADLPLDQFSAVQAALAEGLGSDPSVCDLSRVMRLPGFLHQKGEPWLVQLHPVDTTARAPYPSELFRLPTTAAATPSTLSQGRFVPPETVTELRSALNALHANDYEQWIAVGQALHELGDLGRGLWMDWSQTSEKWRPQDARRWGSFDGSRTGYQAIFTRAQAAGWVNPQSKAAKQVASVGSPTAQTPAGSECVKLTSAASITPKAVRWLWPDWLARGKLHVLAGSPGTGKTTIAMHLAACITSGKQLPSGHCPMPGNVLIWSGEDDPSDTLVPRLLAAGANQDRVHFIDGIERGGKIHRSFDPARDVDILATAAHKLGGVALLIVDPLVSAVSGDSHKNAEVRRGLQPLVELADKLDAALIGITHYSKGTQGGDPLERVTGSVAFGAMARIVYGTVRMKAEDGETSRMVLARAKSNIGPDGGGFAYSFQQRDIADGISASYIEWGEQLAGTARDLLAEPEQENKQGNRSDNQQGDAQDAAAWLRDVLKDQPMLVKDVKKLAGELNYSWRTVERASHNTGVMRQRDGFGAPMTWSLPGAGWLQRNLANSAPSSPISPVSPAQSFGAVAGANGVAGMAAAIAPAPNLGDYGENGEIADVGENAAPPKGGRHG